MEQRQYLFRPAMLCQGLHWGYGSMSLFTSLWVYELIQNFSTRQKSVNMVDWKYRNDGMELFEDGDLTIFKFAALLRGGRERKRMNDAE